MRRKMGNPENPHHDWISAIVQPSENRVAPPSKPHHDYVCSFRSLCATTLAFEGCAWEGCYFPKTASSLDLYKAQPLRLMVAFGASATPGVSLDTGGLRTLVGKGWRR